MAEKANSLPCQYSRGVMEIEFQITRNEVKAEMMMEAFGHGLTFQTVFRTRSQPFQEEDDQVHRFSLKNNLFHYSRLMTLRSERDDTAKQGKVIHPGGTQLIRLN